jgi:membrane dipeptidase
LPPAKAYEGYRSYSYLEAGRDYKEFRLAPQIGRVAEYHGLSLSEGQQQRVARLLGDNIAISLHDHPSVMPEDVDELINLERTARESTGYEGLARSGLTAVFDNFMDGTSFVTSLAGWKWTDVIADIGMRFCDLAHQRFVVLATTLGDVYEAHQSGRIALIAALECATMIENELDRIDILYGFGVRQMGIAYSEANMLGSGLREARDAGLTQFGRGAVKRMNQLGMAIDISHCGDLTSMDVIEHSVLPVFITHGGSRTVWNSPRLQPDNVIKACAERDGVIGIEAAPHTTLSKAHARHNLDSFMDHFVYLVDLVGIEHVGFGPDTTFGDHVALHDLFTREMSINESRGSVEYTKVPYVDGLENPGECFENIVGWLVQHDYSDDEIAAVTGINVLRVLEQIWQ